jgi:hypothetical protein
MGGFSVLSFDRSILENCAVHLRSIPAEDFAQGRLRVGDLEKSKLSAWFNTYWFRLAAQTTRGNLMLLDSLQSQLKVPASDSLAVAEELLDAKLQCSLGGRYVLDSAVWTTTAWPTHFLMVNSSSGSPATTHVGFDSTKCLPPPEYKAPWLEWFRGANLHLTQLPERLIVVGTLDIEPIPIPTTATESATEKPASESLPKMNLDLFSLPFQFFQGDKPKSEKNPAKGKENPPKETRKSF